MKEFPVRSPTEKLGGLVYFGRMLDKIRLHSRAELPADYQPNLGKGFDAKCCAFLHLDYGEVVERVNAGASDDEMLEWAFTHGRRPTSKSRCGTSSCESSAGAITQRRLSNAGNAKPESRIAQISRRCFSSSMR